MLINFIKPSLRALWRKKSFSLLNIMGLATGIAAALLIFLVIRHEMSYDDYQSKRNRIYRVVTAAVSRSNGEVVWRHSMVPEPLAKTLRRDFPALEKVGVISDIGGAQIYVPGKTLADEKRFREKKGLYFAEPSLFEIFDFKWLAGNAAGLQEPYTAVLTESLAKVYFGSAGNAIGKTIQMWSYRTPLRITGVFKDLPENTDIPVRMGASYATVQALDYRDLGLRQDDWQSLSVRECFVLLSQHGDIQRLQARLPAFVKEHYREDEVRTTNTTALSFQPLKGMHLDKRYETFTPGGLSPTELWALALIGVFLLLVACINFVNLATAQSVLRAKEIGVRKVLGSFRFQLLGQFLGETAVITFLSLLAGVVLAYLAVPYLEPIMQKTLALNFLRYPSILFFLIGTGIVVTLLAGFYPAMVLSGMNPIAAIKSKISNVKAGGLSLRRGLVVFQFMIAQLLIIGTLVVIKQMQFFRSQSLGFQKEAVVLLDLPSDSSLQVKYPYLKARLSDLPGVAGTSFCSSEPSSLSGYYSDFYFNHEPDRQPYSVKRLFADTGYLNTFRISLVAGRLPYAGDTARELLVNETLVKKLGLQSAADMLGKTLSFDNVHACPVVGVMRDFNNNSLRDAIAPMTLSSDSSYGTLALRLHPAGMDKTLRQVQQVFTAIYPTYIYDCTFFDHRIGDFYRAEKMTAQLFKIAAILAIFISCLGLYGLVSFMVVQKTKVGIRKVLGASVQNIVYLFSREFSLLISIAFLIAAPLAYYFMHHWLAGFYYHTSMGWGIFVLAITGSVLVAWLAVGYKAIRAALANPVKSLRVE
ncbi:MAG TPA: ABC transporter permease [Chitinophaga sp.]|uniref:ABC transporter permease n=1 Tax=Chitinophaga sp. TaxID=1869181 RepID=UPI002DBFF897|nr:ABC transporter permease [Chitinophaga sp.]HEU4551343.1 ABC transporter permease [Chitinophaga sp.]